MFRGVPYPDVAAASPSVFVAHDYLETEPYLRVEASIAIMMAKGDFRNIKILLNKKRIVFLMVENNILLKVSKAELNFINSIKRTEKGS